MKGRQEAREGTVRSEAELQARSRRQGGFHTLADVFRGSSAGFDGAVLAAVFGSSPEEFERAVEHEVRREQALNPHLFVAKIKPRGSRKARAR